MLHRTLVGLMFVVGISEIACASNPRFERQIQRREIRSSDGSPQRIGVPDAASIRLEFTSNNVPLDASIQIRSVKDGATQKILVRDLFQTWGGKSAYFNGEAVDIELSEGVILIDSVLYQTAPTWVPDSTPASCSWTWEASEDCRIGRFISHVCDDDPPTPPDHCDGNVTGWMFSSNGYVITAAHGAGYAEVFEINPPLSNPSSGVLQHAPPERQFCCVGVRNLMPAVDCLIVRIDVNSNMESVVDLFRSHFVLPAAETITPDLTQVYSFGFGSSTEFLEMNRARKECWGVLLLPAEGNTLFAELSPNSDGASGAPIVEDPAGAAIALGYIRGGTSDGGCASLRISCRHEAIQDAYCDLKADFNRDGVTNFYDFLDFVDSFSAAEIRADIDASNYVDFYDYLEFVDMFATSCQA